MRSFYSFLILLMGFYYHANCQEKTFKIKLDNNATLELTRIAFDTTGKTIEYANNKFVIAINNKPVFGTDGELPKFILTKAILNLNGVRYNLNVDNIYNPWFGENPDTKFFKLNNLEYKYNLQAYFSDGAGGYGVEWLIVNKSSTRTIITNDERILFNYFFK